MDIIDLEKEDIGLKHLSLEDKTAGTPYYTTYFEDYSVPLQTINEKGEDNPSEQYTNTYNVGDIDDSKFNTDNTDNLNVDIDDSLGNLNANILENHSTVNLKDVKVLNINTDDTPHEDLNVNGIDQLNIRYDDNEIANKYENNIVANDNNYDPNLGIQEVHEYFCENCNCYHYFTNDWITIYNLDYNEKVRRRSYSF